MIIRAVIAISLILVLPVGRPGAAFAHAQPIAAPTAALTGRPTVAAATYSRTVVLQNVITARCLTDSPTTGLHPADCTFLDDQRFGLTFDGHTAQDNVEINTMQNMHTGSCVDDSAPYGLRGYFCHPLEDPSRIFQEFKFTYSYPGSGIVVLQNLATGSCVDDSIAYGLRGYFCNGTYFQQWRIFDS
jgi:hypothetical protein